MNNPKIKVIYDDKLQIEQVRVILNPEKNFTDKTISGYKGLVSVSKNENKQIGRITVHCDQISGRKYENQLVDLTLNLYKILESSEFNSLSPETKKTVYDAIHLVGKDRLKATEESKVEYHRLKYGNLLELFLKGIEKNNSQALTNIELDEYGQPIVEDGFTKKTDYSTIAASVLAIIDKSPDKPMFIEETLRLAANYYKANKQYVNLIVDKLTTKYILTVKNLYLAITSSENLCKEMLALCHRSIMTKLNPQERLEVNMKGYQNLVIKRQEEWNVRAADKARELILAFMYRDYHSLQPVSLTTLFEWVNKQSESNPQANAYLKAIQQIQNSNKAVAVKKKKPMAHWHFEDGLDHDAL